MAVYKLWEQGTGWVDASTAGFTASPLTTKGDVWGYSTADARIPVGADGDVLTADSTQALGLKWAAGGGGGVTSLDSITGAVSLVAGSNVTITDNSPSAGDITIAASGGGSAILAYATQLNTVSTSGTTYATGATVFASSPSFTADGTSSYMVRVVGPAQTNTTTLANGLWLTLDAAQSNFMMWTQVNASLQSMPLSAVTVITPTSGSHTVNARFYVSGGTGSLYASPDFSGSPAIVMYVEQL